MNILNELINYKMTKLQTFASLTIKKLILNNLEV